jgi:hypothetical protein
MNAARTFYMKTVKPVTTGATIISMYSGGYSAGATDLIYKKTNTPFIPFVLDIAFCAVIGSCVGITYPVSVPLLLAYEYYQTH